LIPPSPEQRSDAMSVNPSHSSDDLMVRRREWHGLTWWVAYDPSEPVGLIDSYTYVRARTREAVIEKARKRFRSAKPNPWRRVPGQER